MLGPGCAAGGGHVGHGGVVWRCGGVQLWYLTELRTPPSVSTLQSALETPQVLPGSQQDHWPGKYQSFTYQSSAQPIK